MATFALLTSTSNKLELIKISSPALGHLITEFQALVPVITPDRIQILITTPDAQIKALENAYDLFEAGKLTKTRLTDTTKIITGLEINDPDQIRKYIRSRVSSKPTAAQWVFYGAGSESKAYQDGYGFVYKVAPINQAMLDIPKIKDGGESRPEDA